MLYWRSVQMETWRQKIEDVILSAGSRERFMEGESQVAPDHEFQMGQR